MKEVQNERVAGATRSPYQLVFWDWNGTLLDDLQYAIDVRNRVFPCFGLPAIHSIEEYHRQFTFPVRVYYERAGVTDENFVKVAHAWMDEYLRGVDGIPLHGDARHALEAFQNAGMQQVVLSASDRDILTRQIAQYGIEGYFQQVLGLSHIYATSKKAIGETYLAACGQRREGCVLIGDSLHDAEVARELHTQCILVTRGHQSAETLMAAGVPVCGTLLEAAERVLAGPGGENPQKRA